MPVTRRSAPTNNIGRAVRKRRLRTGSLLNFALATLNQSLPTPARRVVLLGASNLTMSFSTVVETLRQTWGEPVEIMAAMGHGRSFGQNSTVLGRKISGIFPCALWQDLSTRPRLPTAALVTDIGNDLLYGVPVVQLANWVAGCLDRLAEAGATTVVTQLPICNLEGLSERRFRFYRQVFFPSCRLELSDVRSTVPALHEQLMTLAAERKISVIPISKSWYGPDPVHIKPSARRTAWAEMLSEWRAADVPQVVARRSVWRWTYLNCLAPAEQSLFGILRRSYQPGGRLADGTTISLY
jgi:hypothetical protein